MNHAVHLADVDFSYKECQKTTEYIDIGSDDDFDDSDE